MLEAYTEDGLCFSVAGAHRGAGSTYVVANLGVVFSELGLRTLIVDANLERARLQKIFDRPHGGGLASIISGDDSHPLCIASLGEFRDLALLPAGRGAARVSSEIGNGVLRDMLVGLKQAYDVVICDSPAASSEADDACEVIAGMCGNTVTVFRKDRTTVSAARNLLGSLDAVGTKQIGSVLCVH
jgi:Mrp family chromosome partitioning ATPase